jgi:alpha-tubulin suppressor-like RCC1 family protein
MRVAFVVVVAAMVVFGFLLLREPAGGAAPTGTATGGTVAVREGVLDAGAAYVVALDESGRVFGWGGHASGDGERVLARTKRPRLLLAGSGYRRVVAGHRAVHVIDAEGVLRRAALDALIDGAEVVPAPVHASRRFRVVRDSWGVVAAIDRGGALWWWSDDAIAEAFSGRHPERHFDPQSLAPGYRFVDVCVQGSRVHAVDDQGRLWRSGDLVRRGGSERPLQAEDGQLARIAAGAELVRVACRENASHVLALARDGSLWGYGSNSFGQLGVGAQDPVAARTADQDATLERIADGPFAAIAVAPSVSFAVARDGSLWGWGRNLDHELGTGDTAPNDGPVAIDRERVRVAVAATYGTGVALDAHGVLQAWGGNALGALGDGGIAVTHDRPADVLTDIRFGGSP